MSDGPRAFTVKQKENSQKLAEELRKQLASKHFRAKADSSSPELFTFSRKWEDVDYLFVINDKRTFGDYFGPWGRMMEKGLPFSGWASIQDPKRSVKAVYELYKGGEIKFKRDGENVVVPLEYDTNDGRILAFLPDRIARLDVRSSEEVAPGGIVKAGYRIIGENGQRISALLPGEIHLYDADGVELDGAGYVAAEDGIAQLAIRTNLNDAPGDYRLVCKDRASGLVVEKTIKRK